MTAVDQHDRPGGALSEDGDEGSHDLVFVGAGASTSYVLLALLTTLAADPPARPLRIAVVEQAPDPFPGVAYGSRAARTSLLITPLRDFLPPEELRLFTGWLAENWSWALEEFLAAGGPVSSRWWERHREAVTRGEFEDLFLPRYVFGLHLAGRVREAIDLAARVSAATVDLLQDEVGSLDPDGPVHLVTGRRCRLRARHVVLATGSAPVVRRLEGAGGPHDAVLIDRPFDDMGEGLERTRAAVARRPADAGPPHVVVIGGNAGTMDVLYQVNDLPVVAERGTVFTVLTPGGALPELLAEPRPGFVAGHLLALRSAPAVTAREVHAAALADLADGRAAGLTVGDTLRPISQGVSEVLPRLSEEQTLEFAGHWGVELGRHQRRAGWEYTEVVEELTRAGRMSLVAGSFTGLATDGGAGVRVRYSAAGVPAELDRPADVVVNCAGPTRALRDAVPSLVASLLDRGVLRPTPYGGGIAVDRDLAAAPRLYVMGPLLAGNIVHGQPVWHMEHCGRISAYGTRLGRSLAATLTTPAPAPR
ncbi:FAD/NAD(P)-binding protein [Modestobacter sp. L9-4]|uniref:FAD/NAD(P)-binding protein n=1 Tax=Modestobacter sp. L9-4 TaxID=2851567 RepID=UPI001C789471|nr:FAD/NAD(P)-binding protein [Modestobacter sp. L9-4]QXG74785.1 FAD/NAD(P)-binding protein [Modestobacter sp. L9-4]